MLACPGLGRGGFSSRTQSMQLRVSEETGFKSQHNFEGPRRWWNPGRRLPEGKQNKGEKEGRRINEEGGHV